MNKEFKLERLVRPNVMALKPYSSARDEFTNFESDMIYLDANENPFQTSVNRYPDPWQKQLKSVIGAQKQVSIENMLLGNGSDEVLDVLIRAFCEPTIDSVITLPPTYGMYKVLADIHNVKNIEVQLTKDFEPNVDEILKHSSEKTKLLFICNPNNPTGNTFSEKKVSRLLDNFNGIVVIDEAYIDFSEKESWLNRLEAYPNLVITQTLSKAYGMAGIRLGICYASAEIISVLNKIKPPYNVNSLTQSFAINRLKDLNKLKVHIDSILIEKKSLYKVLLQVKFIKNIIPSDTNFLLCTVDNADLRYQQLIDHGIVVRNRSSQVLCENTLRFTIGTSEENTNLINTLKKLEA